MPINISANMSLPVPVVGQEPGPDYATDLNTSLTIIDGHNHASGSGVQINPGGININADLAFNGNNQTGLRSSRYNSQGMPLALAADLGCVYVSSADLYYNDTIGNQVRLTQGGAVAGTPGSISGLAAPASASYNGGSSTFIFQSGANISGNIDGGSLIIRETVAAANGITISSPLALAASYALTLPTALPGGLRILTLDASGVIGTLASVGSGLSLSGAVISIATQGVTQSMLAARATGTTVGSGGIAVSASTGSQATGNAEQAVPEFNLTITTTGRPVMVMLQPDGISAADLGPNGTGPLVGNVHFKRDGVLISSHAVAVSGSGVAVPPGSVIFADLVAAGTYNYTGYIGFTLGTGSMAITNCVMVVYEQ